MFKASQARKAAIKYEQKLNKIELKDIMKLVNEAACQGYMGMTWYGNIRKDNINTLRKHGYKVTRVAHRVFNIDWDNYGG